MPKWSRKRVFSKPVTHLNVLITVDAKDKLVRMAGPDSQGYVMEELINREYRRRERKQEQHVQESALTAQQMVQ